MKVVQGDLIELATEGVFDVIVHGCNCYCTMGSGVARAIKEAFPEAYEVDCQTMVGSILKLGDISVAKVVIDGRYLWIVNAYTQFRFGSGRQVDYDATREALKKVKQRFTGLSIGYPKIGAGLGGGDWEILSAIFDEELADEDHTLVEFAG